MVRVQDLFNLTPSMLMDFKAEIPEEKMVYYIAALREVARIGGVSSTEDRFIKNLITYLDLPADVPDKARNLTENQSLSLGELTAKMEEPLLRVCLLRDAYVMVMLDENVDEVEWLTLERLAGALGLSHSVVKKVTRLVDDIVEIKAELEELSE
ncbi:MAG: hypothetical protein JXQ83_09140 [Candidatus Glassbacteria bacterium]|nr:hypothetical protein [Candidatus Glassbacteria bacterium]